MNAMTMPFIHIERQTLAGVPVATVWLNREDLHNAFNDAMIAQLHQAFTDLSADTSVRAVILAAKGKSFCAGADLNWMQSMLNYTFDENVTDATALARMLAAINQCAKPVIARVHGAAFGGGVGLVSACDLVVAVEKASFCLSEVKLGLLPAVISPFVLAKMPEAHARRYFLTAERFSAAEAHRVGLVSEVVADEAACDAMIATWLTALAQNGPQAVSLCKPLIQDVKNQPLETAIDITTKRIAERRISDEGQEGMRSFLDKRPPSWAPKQ